MKERKRNVLENHHYHHADSHSESSCRSSFPHDTFPAILGVPCEQMQYNKSRWSRRKTISTSRNKRRSFYDQASGIFPEKKTKGGRIMMIKTEGEMIRDDSNVDDHHEGHESWVEERLSLGINYNFWEGDIISECMWVARSQGGSIAWQEFNDDSEGSWGNTRGGEREEEGIA